MATKVKKTAEAGMVGNGPGANGGANAEGREATFEVFRRWGYLQTTLDPLGQYLPKEPFPIALPEGEEDAAAEARGFYCGTIGLEFMHIANAEKREWLQEQHGAGRASRRPGEGAYGADQGGDLRAGDPVALPGDEAVFARGSDSADSLPGADAGGGRGLRDDDGGDCDEPSRTAECDDEHDRARSEGDLHEVRGCGSAQHHGRRRCEVPHGRDGRVRFKPTGQKVALHLVSNPSHLEAVDPVALGRARAKQARMDDSQRLHDNGQVGKKQVLPIMIHGDAAFAGQGMTAELLNMATLHGYNVGGTIHVVVNNLLGFTAVPEESNSSRFATDWRSVCRFRSSM